MEALIPPDGEENCNVLQNNQHADEKQQHHFTGPTDAGPFPLSRVVVVDDYDRVHPLLYLITHTAWPFLTFLGHTAEGGTALDTEARVVKLAVTSFEEPVKKS